MPISEWGYATVNTRVWDVNTLTWVPMQQPILNAGSVTVTGTVDQGTGGSSAWLTKEIRSSTPGQSTVASSASNVTLLAANSARLGATVYNDSTQIVYVKLGTTASSSSYTVQMVAGAYYEVPFNYTGIVSGIWASANGNARVTELTV